MFTTDRWRRVLRVAVSQTRDWATMLHVKETTASRKERENINAACLIMTCNCQQQRNNTVCCSETQTCSFTLNTPLFLSANWFLFSTGNELLPWGPWPPEWKDLFPLLCWVFDFIATNHHFNLLPPPFVRVR